MVNKLKLIINNIGDTKKTIELKNFVKKITPKIIKKKLDAYYSSLISNNHYRNSIEKERLIPLYELAEILKNLKVLPGRCDLLKQLPKKGVVALNNGN